VKVGVADGQVVTATSKGTWILESVFRDQQCRAVLENTLLIPGVPYNLVAVSKMVKDGHHFTGATFFKIMLGNVLVVGGIMCNVGLYKVDVNSSIQKALLAPKTCTTGISLIDLWHLRLGHASAPYLKRILKLPANATLSYCDTCMSTSTTTLPFSHKTQSTPMKVQNVLELVMADIVGPFPTRSYQGSNFMAVVVDYASRMKWPLGLAYKSTYVPKYIDWHVFITKHTGKQIKHYHTDGGGAVARSTTLITFHNKMGTKATMNTADQHNQNPIPERQIGLVVRGIRALLKESGAPQYLWEFAAMYFIYVSNRTPTRSNDWRTPISCFGGPDSKGDVLKYCKIFGALANVHLPKNKRASRLSDTSIVCAYLGVHSILKGCIYMELKSKRVFQSRNGYSNETVQPFITNPLGRFRVQSKTKPQPVVFNSPADFYKLSLPRKQATTSPLPLPPPLDHGEFDAGTPLE